MGMGIVAEPGCFCLSTGIYVVGWDGMGERETTPYIHIPGDLVTWYLSTYLCF